MLSSTDMQWTIVMSTLVVMLLLGFLLTLVLLNNNRRIRHQVELAEAEQRRGQEVMRAEREATQQTLHEVGRELHDNVAQLLTVAQMGVYKTLETTIHAYDPRLSAARDALDQGIEEVRRLGHDLNSDRWKHRTLQEAISAEAERIERVGRVHAHVIQRSVAPEPGPDARIILYRVFQEVVNNALKHSGADTLTITINGSEALTLTIADNGCGFEPGRERANGGLLSIPKRCALIGYSATCNTAPHQGCTWTIEPLPEHGA